MSRIIKITQQHMDDCRRDFETAQLIKMVDGKRGFTKTLPIAGKEAIVYFTYEAWSKMAILIKTFDKEVAWHGIASRGSDNSRDEYIISDIVIYPQEVSSTRVEIDTEEYAKWLMENAEDERFDYIRMQGHSHVNMRVLPSEEDLHHQEEILSMLDDDDFYIFMIWNKAFFSNTRIYDMKKNVLFKNRDVSVRLIGATGDLDTFLADAKRKVRTKSCSCSGDFSDKASVDFHVPLSRSASKKKSETKMGER